LEDPLNSNTSEASEVEETWKRILSIILFSLLLGIPGCGMALGDLVQGRTILDWIVLGAAYFLFSGLLLGLAEPRFWYFALFTVWGPAAVTIMILVFDVGQQPFTPATLYVPILATLLGGLTGSAARARIGAR
jgi:hypothetical protein